MDLSGDWHGVADPYQTGLRNNRNWMRFDEGAPFGNARPYFTPTAELQKDSVAEMDFERAEKFRVPGDWSHQRPELSYYEGLFWYWRRFDYQPSQDSQRLVLSFEGSNYATTVYVNGEKVGDHLGGFTPFEFDVTSLIRPGENEICVAVDNTRAPDRVPGMTTDWWNYGGLTRPVRLIEVPELYVHDYCVHLDPRDPSRVAIRVTLAGSQVERVPVRFSLGDSTVEAVSVTNSEGEFFAELDRRDLALWSPDSPILHPVEIQAGRDLLRDEIGLRTIQTEGCEILLNGEPIFLRGVSLHEEEPGQRRRGWTNDSARARLEEVKSLGANFVRLAHYPHSEAIVREADRQGILLWSEIPVYWGLDFSNRTVLEQARNQLVETVHRDKNRCSVICWSLANETPPTEDRNRFLGELRSTLRTIDQSRLVTAALESSFDEETKTVRVLDPFASGVDLLSLNEYYGWYRLPPEGCAEVSWSIDHDKPLIISEFGAGAVAGLRGPQEERWSEDHQAWIYREQLAMLEKIPQWRGVTPWILHDFRSPRRNFPGIQDGWNRKGLIGSNGKRKLAFEVLREFYEGKIAAPKRDLSGKSDSTLKNQVTL